MEIGNEVEINLSRSTPAKPGAAGENRTGQPPWGETGQRGGHGTNGGNGRPGAGLDLMVAHPIGEGSLRIRTDGQGGGGGGGGGTGQTGGGTSCVPGRERFTNGGTGGRGGDGGDGGSGGATSLVRIHGLEKASPECGTPCSGD